MSIKAAAVVGGARHTPPAEKDMTSFKGGAARLPCEVWANVLDFFSDAELSLLATPSAIPLNPRLQAPLISLCRRKFEKSYGAISPVPLTPSDPAWLGMFVALIGPDAACETGAPVGSSFILTRHSHLGRLVPGRPPQGDCSSGLAQEALMVLNRDGLRDGPSHLLGYRRARALLWQHRFDEALALSRSIDFQNGSLREASPSREPALALLRDAIDVGCPQLIDHLCQRGLGPQAAHPPDLLADILFTALSALDFEAAKKLGAVTIAACTTGGFSRRVVDLVRDVYDLEVGGMGHLVRPGDAEAIVDFLACHGLAPAAEMWLARRLASDARKIC